MQENSIDYHLTEALGHLEAALNQSIDCVLDNEGSKREIAPKWESFLGDFFGMVRQKGKQSRVNPLAWISFPKLK